MKCDSVSKPKKTSRTAIEYPATFWYNADRLRDQRIHTLGIFTIYLNTVGHPISKCKQYEYF